jgi:nucleotide-binding universal stress UspA family protein
MYNKILVPLDGSRFAECSIAHVKEVATGCHTSEVTLLMALEPVYTSSFWPASLADAERIGEDDRQKKADMQDKAAKYLTQVADSLRKSGLTVNTVVTEESSSQSVADVILDFIKKYQTDLIIMSTHGRSGIGRWAIGSVADKIVRHSTIPVLTVAPEGCVINP